jgi:lipopolysaccharide/colanic/teichoic acid biosynthesis glycosyltransferase
MAKRLFDVTVAALALVLLSPLLVMVAILVYLNIGSPVLFRQLRPGLHGRPENIKFRSMRDAIDEAGNPLPDDQRLSRFGALLRSTSLDELPELWNVLKGHMSLVRPPADDRSERALVCRRRVREAFRYLSHNGMQAVYSCPA